VKLVDARRLDLMKQLAVLEAAPGNEKAANATSQRTALEGELQELDLERDRLVETLLGPAVRDEMVRVRTTLRKLSESLTALPAPQKVFAAANRFSAVGSFQPTAEPRPVSVLRRGEVRQPIRLAEPGALACLPGLPARFQLADSKDEGRRRAALAQWITDPANLLTRRSLVNRVWQHHFGRGIVDTPNDFGHMGSLPTHPELLDWLAFWFHDHGESLKELHRLLLTSSTYRQAATDNPEWALVDADNRFLWHMNRSRLDAESLRDSILFVSGRLDRTMGGPSDQQFFFKDDHSPIYDYARFDVDSPQGRRRCVYRFVVRSVPDPFLETLDCPDPSLLAPKRSTTLTALQALALLNDPFVLRQAECFAARLAKSGRRLPDQVKVACQLVFSRPPSSQEAPQMFDYAQKHGLTNLCRVLLNTSEFMFVD
jgi:hypothetical protein